MATAYHLETIAHRGRLPHGPDPLRCPPALPSLPGAGNPEGGPEAERKTPAITGTRGGPAARPATPQGLSGRSLGAGTVALRQCLEVHGEGLLLGLGGPLPFGACQDVEHDQGEASQQQAQHIGQDTLRLKRAVFGPAGSGWEGEATRGHR